MRLSIRRETLARHTWYRFGKISRGSATPGPLCLTPILALVILAGDVGAQEQVLRVATKEAPPFAFRDAAGQWTGISIDLWDMIAQRLDLRYEWVELPLDAMFEQLERQELDVAIAAISVTPEREQRVDFTQPYYYSGIGAAVAIHHQGSVWKALAGLLTRRTLFGIVAVLGFLIVAACCFWFFERKKNEMMPDRPREGIRDSVWWSTIILLGHKGIVPKSWPGRMIALTMMLISFVAVSLLTGAIASVMTISQMSMPITHWEDLRALRTATVSGSTSADLLRKRRIDFLAFESANAALDAVAAGRADVVVYDAPVLRYLVRQRYAAVSRVLSVRFTSEDYAIALPPDSAMRKTINHALLTIRADEAWQDLIYRYLGD